MPTVSHPHLSASAIPSLTCVPMLSAAHGRANSKTGWAHGLRLEALRLKASNLRPQAPGLRPLALSRP